MAKCFNLSHMHMQESHPVGGGGGGNQPKFG